MQPRVIYKSYIEQAFIRGSSARDIKLNSLFVSRRVWHWHTWRVMRRTCPVQCHTQPLERQRKIYIPDIDSAVFPLSLIADDIRMRTKIWHKGIQVPGKQPVTLPGAINFNFSSALYTFIVYQPRSCTFHVYLRLGRTKQ